MSTPHPRDYAKKIDSPLQFDMHAIGIVRSEHKERHGTPRQASVKNERGQRSGNAARVELDPSRIPLSALKDLEGFGRIWLIGIFHLNHGWKDQVVPPRGPKEKRGLLATRSPHRPNRIALSCCPLERIEGHTLYLGATDLLDGTPIVDIKPYVPFADSFPDSPAGWVDTIE